MNNPEVSDKLSRSPASVNRVVCQQYKVVVSMHVAELQDTVNRLLSLGWQITGGLTVNDSYFYQAMIREKP